MVANVPSLTTQDSECIAAVNQPSRSRRKINTDLSCPSTISLTCSTTFLTSVVTSDVMTDNGRGLKSDAHKAGANSDVDGHVRRCKRGESERFRHGAAFDEKSAD